MKYVYEFFQNSISFPYPKKNDDYQKYFITDTYFSYLSFMYKKNTNYFYKFVSAKMSLRRAVIILNLFIWCAYVGGGSSKEVNCA